MNTVPILIVVAIFAFLAVQFMPLFKARRMRGQAAPALDAVLEPRQRNQPRLLLYFWSPSCAMCRGMTPVIDALSRERDDVVKIDITQHLPVARAYSVLGTPTLVLIKDGKVAQMLVGAKSEKHIRDLLR